MTGQEVVAVLVAGFVASGSCKDSEQALDYAIKMADEILNRDLSMLRRTPQGED